LLVKALEAAREALYQRRRAGQAPLDVSAETREADERDPASDTPVPAGSRDA
jgi:hypothetical protein